MNQPAPLTSVPVQPRPPVECAVAAAAPAPVSLRVNFYWTLAGHVVAAACKWLELTLLAKTGTRDMVGQFAFALALTAPIVMLTNLQLRTVQATDARGQFPFETYLGVRLVGTGLALAAIAAVAWLQGTPGVFWIVIAMGVAKAIEAMSDVFHGLLQRHERLDVISRSLMAKGVLSIVAMAVALRATGSVLWAVVGIGTGSAVVLLGYDVPQSRPLWRAARRAAGARPRILDPVSLARLTRVAFPLGVVMMLASVGANVPRYFIEHQLGVGELGVFSAVSYVMLAGLTVVGALGHAAFPRLSRHHAAGERAAFVRVGALLLGLAVALGAGGVAVALVSGGPVLSLLYRAEYSAAQPVLVWTMIGATAAYVGTAFDCCLTAARTLRAQAPLWIAMVAATAAACVLLVPRFGLVGAAAGAAIGYTVQAAGAGWLLRRALRLREAVIP